MKTPSQTVIRLSSVSLIRDRKQILTDISWQIKNGEHWVLMGRNGSGKTMLLKIVSGYLWPTNGTVEVLGKKFGEVDLRELRKQIGWVSSDLQNQMQKNLKVVDVVLSGYYASLGLYDKPDDAVTKSAEELLEFMHISNLRSHLFPTLSYGEQKRVLIARALIHNPKLLILDEPCTGLDIKAREEFLPFIEKLGKKAGGPTIIFVTHHVEEIVHIFSHALMLKNGQIVRQGSRAKMFSNNVLQEVFEVKLTMKEKNGRYIVQMGDTIGFI